MNGHYFRHFLDGWGSFGVDGWGDEKVLTLVLTLPFLGIDDPEDWLLCLASTQVTIQFSDIMFCSSLKKIFLRSIEAAFPYVKLTELQLETASDAGVKTSALSKPIIRTCVLKTWFNIWACALRAIWDITKQSDPGCEPSYFVPHHGAHFDAAKDDVQSSLLSGIQDAGYLAGSNDMMPHWSFFPETCRLTSHLHYKQLTATHRARLEADSIRDDATQHPRMLNTTHTHKHANSSTQHELATFHAAAAASTI